MFFSHSVYEHHFCFGFYMYVALIFLLLNIIFTYVLYIIIPNCFLLCIYRIIFTVFTIMYSLYYFYLCVTYHYVFIDFSIESRD